MAAGQFDKYLRMVKTFEGGFVNHPKDPGGATNMGITQNTYDNWRRSIGQKLRSVRSIGHDEVAAIYRRDYWDKIKGDMLPMGIDYATFDFAVNSGPARAAKFLQRILCVPEDGKIGPQTLYAAAKSNHRDVALRLCEDRLRFLQSLKTWPTFGKGWGRRVSSVIKDLI